jgi:hypothetical protein
MQQHALALSTRAVEIGTLFSKSKKALAFLET